jgi:hypothetical protein
VKILHCFASGLRRMVRCPSLALWLYAASLVLAVPLAFLMRGILRDAIGASLVHQALRSGFDLDWFSQFRFSHSGIADTFGPGVVGFLPVLANFDRLLSGTVMELDWGALAAALMFLVAWAFFGGGIVARFGRSDEPYTRSNFFSVCGEFFPPFLRLMVITVAVYAAFVAWVMMPAARWIEKATRDVTREGTVILCFAALYAVSAAFLVIVGLVSDYAKVSMVLERRRSAVLAIGRACRLAAGNAGRTVGLYLLLAGAGIAGMAAFALVAPGPGQAGPFSLAFAFLVGQVFLWCRIGMKLWFLASQTEMYRAIRDERVAAGSATIS